MHDMRLFFVSMAIVDRFFVGIRQFAEHLTRVFHVLRCWIAGFDESGLPDLDVPFISGFLFPSEIPAFQHSEVLQDPSVIAERRRSICDRLGLFLPKKTLNPLDHENSLGVQIQPACIRYRHATGYVCGGGR